VNFIDFLKLILAPAEHPKDDIVNIRVMPTTDVAIRKSALTDKNKKTFILEMQKVPNIHKGLSYLNIAEGFPMSEPAAIMCQAVGRAFKVWTLTPMDLGDSALIKSMVDEDYSKALPMNTGLNPRGVQID